nr:gastrula zinc finger protein XlCGF71.1-like isoform X2 [Procambarus clarkii]XP_045599673.1 gastrula zinc finger protein XlCGF71.1-like isoform X2 [Procambarus clarkii]
MGLYSLSKSSSFNVSSRISVSLREPYQCSICFRLFARYSQIEKHSLIHTRKKPFKCTKCFMDLPTEPALMRHIKSVHLKKKPRWCLECDKSSKPIHTTRHEAEYIPKPYQCAVCLQDFALKIDAAQHIKNHTTDVPYQCPICQLMYKTKAALSRHKEQHVNDNFSTTRISLMNVT